MDDFDLTQPMSLCYDDDDPSTEANEAAILKIPLQDGIPRELEFPLFNGVNKIGRSESCEVCISNKVLSKEHAVIEVGGDCFLIYDLNSSNKTWRGKKPLKPNVKYKLEPSEEVRFGNIKAQFIVKKHEVDDGEDSGSETGSESMLLLNEEYHAFSMSTPIKDSGVNDRGSDPSEDASTSDVLFPKNISTAEAKKAESPKEAALDLENAPTQVFNGSDLPDSGDETDCEENSALKAVAGEKEIHCDRAPDPGVGGETTTKQTTSDNIVKIVDSGGVSGVSSRSFQKVPDQIQKDENMINILLPVKNSFKELQKLPECHSLESNEDLPATQLNFDLQEPGVSGYSRNTESAKKLNNEHKGEVLDSLDSLPETQINIDLEIPESPQAKANDDLPPTQCSSNSESNIGNFNNNVSKRRVKVLESDDDTDGSDDLPPTQPNLALQFSEEQNFLQRGDSQSLFNKRALSSGASTSYAANWCKNTVVPNPLLCSVESSKKSNISSEGYPKKTDRLSSSSNKSGRAPFLTSINISLEEGSTEDGSILCPSTMRRSDICNEKIKNTDVQCSPTLGVASTEQGEDSIAETPPHLLKESAFSFGNSSAVTSLSKQFAEVSPAATANFSSRSHSRSEIRTSDDSHTPSTHGKRESKVPTPDSAKAGELNYSVNCSSKVYKPKLNDMDKDSQEIVHPEQNVSETINSSVLKNTGKPSTAREAALMLANEDNRESDDSDAADRGKRKSKRSKKHTAVKKTDDHGTEVGRRAVAKRLSPDSDTQSKAKKSRTRKAIAGGKLTDLSTGHHNFETNDHEGSNQDEMPQRRKSKRCAVPAKYVDLESDISKKPRFESENDTEQSSITECHTEQPILEDSTVSSTNTSDSKLSVNRRSARKKKSKNDQDIQPTRRSKRQKDISLDVMKELDESDSRDDFESIPPRKTARRKLLQSESGRDVSDAKQEVGFCVFRKSEALEVEADNLLDSRTQKRRKPSPLKNNLNDGPPQSKEQSKKLNQLTLNSSEVSVGSSGEQCYITVQNGQSDHVENLKSDDKNEKISFGDDSSGLRTRAVRGLTGLSVPIQRLPNTPPQRSRVKRKTPGGTDKSEMQSDPHSETMKSNGHLSNTENEAEESTLSEKRDSPDKKRVSRPRRSHKKGAPHADSTDESFSTTVSLDTSVKTDEGTALTELKKNCLGNIRAPRSKRLRKKEEVPTEDSLSSAILDSSTRSLRLRLSTSEASADERPSASEKCQISVFAKDSVKSLIKLDSGSLDSNESKDREIIPSRVSRKAKPSEKEVNEATISEVKNSQKSKAKLDSEDPPSPPTGRRKNKRNQNLNLSLVSDSVSEKDATPAKNKKTKGTKNKHVAFTSPSPRQQQQVPKPKVMFTMVEDEEPQKVVVDLGGKVVEDVKLCTHLVAEKLRRTVKALCCIAKGIPLVNTKWIQECKKSESFVDHAPYLIKDKAAEKQYQFELKKTLQKANEKPLLTSWSVHVTPKVVPNPEQMKDIIQCAGGKYLPKMPNRLSEKTVVITCAPDLNLCSHASKCGIPVVGSEFILTGLLQYKIDTKSYMLCKK